MRLMLIATSALLIGLAATACKAEQPVPASPVAAPAATPAPMPTPPPTPTAIPTPAVDAGGVDAPATPAVPETKPALGGLPEPSFQLRSPGFGGGTGKAKKTPRLLDTTLDEK